jgi:hypothetical protein
VNNNGICPGSTFRPIIPSGTLYIFNMQTLQSPSVNVDPGLAFVVDTWRELPEVVRAGIVAMVKAACAK